MGLQNGRKTQGGGSMPETNLRTAPVTEMKTMETSMHGIQKRWRAEVEVATHACRSLPGPFGACGTGVLQISVSLSRGVLSHVSVELEILRNVDVWEG